MYETYNRIRAYLFRLLDSKFGTKTERMRYFSSFISGYDFDSLLDIGCGMGLLFDNMSSSGDAKLLVGVDLMKTRKGRYQHVVASATALPLIDGAFSLVTAYSLVEHISEEEREPFYREAKRVTKNHGTFLIQLPNRYFIIESHTYMPFFGFLPSKLHSFAYRGEYVAVPSIKTVLGSLEENGFEVCNIERYEGQFLPFSRFFRSIGLFYLFPMGYIIYARVRKTKDDRNIRLMTFQH
jgi:SAM-dependent methyltransferase